MKTNSSLIVGTRTSRLARWQTERVVEMLRQSWPELHCTVKPFVTRGDKTLDRPLPEIGGKGLFTAELERALHDEEIDIAVHSLKDLPVANAPGLTLGAVADRADVKDGLIAAGGRTLETLPSGAVVGTSSLRRQAQILAARPDLRVRSIRGNVGTRARKALEGEYDATVLAAAGLHRLEMDDLVSQWLPLAMMLPAPGQGALAIQCRAGDERTLALLAAIDDEKVRLATTAERQFLQALGGGCSAPIAAYATVGDDGGVHLRGLIGSPDGRTIIRVESEDQSADRLAGRLAEEAKEKGATAILQEVEKGRPVQLTAAPKPLDGRRVVVTRPPHQAPEMAEQLRALGATPILFPTIEIRPMADPSPLDAAIRRLEGYDWAIFTSVNGVTHFWERLEAQGLEAPALDGIRVAAIGPATGEALANRGVTPDFIPDEFVAEAIAEGLGDVSGRSFLLPRAEIARKKLAEMLAQAGGHVDEIASYRTLPARPEAEDLAALEGADIITFTSSSTVRNFVELVGGAGAARRLVKSATLACIGPITAGTVEEELDLAPAIVATNYTIDGLLEAIVAALGARQASDAEKEPGKA